MRREGYSSWFVCLGVCRRLFWHYRRRGGLLAIAAASELREPEKYRGDYPETTAFERYAVKSPICIIALDLLRPDPLVLCTYRRFKKTQRRACIDSRILSTAVASPCKTLRELLAGETASKRILNSPAHQLAVPRMRSSRRVCTSVLFIIVDFIITTRWGPASPPISDYIGLDLAMRTAGSLAGVHQCECVKVLLCVYLSTQLLALSETSGRIIP